MATIETGSELGWIHNPETASDIYLYDIDLDGLTYELTRYRIAYGRASKWGGDLNVTAGAGGVLQIGIGNFPTEVTCTPLSDAVARITWQYNPKDQPVAPTGFKVYHRSDAGDPWVQDLSSETYSERRRKYYHTSSELTAKVWDFGVSTYRTTSELDPVVNSCLIDTTAKVDTDYPTNAKASPILGGYARVSWQYQATAAPTGFKIYERSDAGDAWVQDLAAVTYNSRAVKYYHVSSELSDKLHYFKISNYDGGGNVDSDFASCITDGTGPAAISDISATLPEWDD